MKQDYDYNEKFLEGVKAGLKARHDNGELDDEKTTKKNPLGPSFLLGTQLLDTKIKRAIN